MKEKSYLLPIVGAQLQRFARRLVGSDRHLPRTSHVGQEHAPLGGEADVLALHGQHAVRDQRIQCMAHRRAALHRYRRVQGRAQHHAGAVGRQLLAKKDDEGGRRSRTIRELLAHD